MSNFTANCLSDVPQSLLPNITACQTSATTPFCWPPNGTRICVPAPSGIPIYWPPSYYPTSSLVLIEWDLSSSITPARNNTGNRTQSIPQYIYEQFALAIPGAPMNERSLKLYMRSRVGGGEVVNHEGPTVVLVKTAEFTRASSYPTSTRSAGSSGGDDDRDPLSGLTSGEMAGIIVGIFVAVVALITLCCCCGCCTCSGAKARAARARRAKVDEEGQAAIVARGVELMEQKGGARPATLDPGRGVVQEEIGVARTSRGNGDEIGRVELDAGREEPPPRYTP